jgi:replicative DNA helicase
VTEPALKLVAPASAEPEVEGYEFDDPFQQKIAALTMRDPIFAARTDGLIKPEYFENEFDATLVKIALDHFATYKQVPDLTSWATVIKDAIRAKKVRVTPASMPEFKDRLHNLLTATPVADRELAIVKVAEFARSQAMSAAILKAVELTTKGDYAAIEKVMQAALSVGAQSDSMIYDYWNEIENRTQERKDLLAGVAKPTGITTGLKEIDAILYHNGWGRKELSLMMGAAKAGKSMSLGEFAKNASLAGLNVIYISLEVAAKIIAERTDANVSSTPIKDVKGKPFDVEAKVKALAAAGKLGKLHFTEYASGTFTPGQLRRLLEKQRQQGHIYDLIVVDYADIMAPDRRSDNNIDNLRDIYLQLRAIAFEQNAALLSATQTNREGAKRATPSMTDVAEDFNKIRTADVVIAIASTEAERSAGECRLHFVAHRNGESDFSLTIRQDRSRMQFISKVIGRTH